MPVDILTRNLAKLDAILTASLTDPAKRTGLATTMRVRAWRATFDVDGEYISVRIVRSDTQPTVCVIHKGWQVHQILGDVNADDLLAFLNANAIQTVINWREVEGPSLLAVAGQPLPRAK